MMRPKIFALTALLGCMAFTRLYAPAETQTAQSATATDNTPCASTNNTFNVGETLVYKIYYNWNFVWIPAGEVVFKVFDEGDKYHYQAKGRTYESYEWFYVVRDDYDSWVDKKTLLPLYSERSVNEGDYHIFEKISFVQPARQTTVWRAPKRGEKETKTEHKVNDCVHDVLSTLYFLRNVDFENREKGYAVPFRIFMDQEEYPLKFKYEGKEARKKIYGLGRHNTMRFQPEVIVGNVFKDGSKMQVWVSDDGNRLPLLIESPISVGSVKMVLKSHKGLKYDLNTARK